MKRVLLALALTSAIISFVAAAVLLLFVDTAPLSRAEYVGAFLKFRAFNMGLAELDEAEVKTLYRLSCTIKCHGAGPVETARHTSREWQVVIQRMRANGARISGKEEAAIVGYLQKNYGSNVPTILSPRANRFLKQFLWKSDFGESDLYVDIIYAPPEYFELMGGLLEGRNLGADENLVFMVYLNTHQDRLKPWPLKDLAALKDPSGAELKPTGWRITYKSGDEHHLEGVMTFEGKEAGGEFMELVLRDLPGQKERVFRWDLPIPQFEEER